MEEEQYYNKNKHHFKKFNITTQKVIFFTTLIFCLSSLVSPPLALLLGIMIAQFVGHPYLHVNHKITHLLLQICVVGLGFGIDVNTALKVGKEGILFTVFSIFGTLLLGYLLGKFLKINNKISFLIAVGTAICGGSAIAAVSPVIKAEEKQISVALGTIFILNSIALFVFPFIGNLLELSQSQFGLWSAIAIHDTSSVVGAASKYGNDALQIATTVKLARALWIIPIAFLSSFVFKSENKKIKIPYFIGLFVMAIIINTYVPFIQKFSTSIVTISKLGLTVTLFLIGCGLSRKILTAVGLKPILQGILLWIVISLTTLLALLHL